MFFCLEPRYYRSRICPPRIRDGRRISKLCLKAGIRQSRPIRDLGLVFLALCKPAYFPSIEDLPKTDAAQMPGQSSFYTHVIFANIWQVAVSIVYVQYQALLSSILVADEWGRFASSKKTARVSHPIGLQRSTYFISLPWKYGGTLLGVMILLHWLISQSVFLIQIESISSDGTVLTPWNQSADGYSILPIICGKNLYSRLCS